MAYKWPDKDKDELVDYSVDWSRFIDKDTIASVLWYIKDAAGVKTLVIDSNLVDGLQFVTGTLIDKVTTARFSLGTSNKRYTVICGITTGNGLVYERSIFLRIREK
tara:strand:- start:132 stop:449 length:318 start_codon:yes stop_codon:yes gene_type:complete